MTHEARIQERLRQLSREATDYGHGEDSQGDATALLAGADALLGVEEAKAALEVAQRDAARWRWTRDRCATAFWGDQNILSFLITFPAIYLAKPGPHESADEIDSAIDFAIKERTHA